MRIRIALTDIASTMPSPWERMDAQPRRSMKTLKAADLPGDPGCYALYRGTSRMYVGRADCLHNRVWKNHSGRGPVMTGSALRRNVAEHLGVATANEIKRRSTNQRRRS